MPEKEGAMSFTISSGNENISTLFSSLSASNKNSSLGSLTSTIAGLTTDYASIRNGSYNKVVKAYYAKADKTEESSGSKKDSKTKETAESRAEAYSKTTSAATSVESVASALTKDSLYYESTYDATKMYAKAQSFVDSYNSLMDSALNSDSVSIQKKGLNMVQLSYLNREALGKIGIEVSTEDDVTLTIDSNKFKSASASDVAAIFGKDSKYSKNIIESATAIKEAASTEAATYTSSAAYDNKVASVGNMFDEMF